MDASELNRTFTTEEVNEDIERNGCFFALPDLTSLGVTDVAKSFQNFVEGAARSREAYRQGFYIEVLNLRVQHTEFWLRVLLVHNKSNGFVIPPNDKRTFGRIIEECAPVLPTPLLTSLRAFNDARIDAVHKYLLGGTDYDALKEACDNHFGIDSTTRDFVISQVGRPTTAVEGRIGEWVVRVESGARAGDAIR